LGRTADIGTGSNIELIGFAASELRPAEVVPASVIGVKLSENGAVSLIETDATPSGGTQGGAAVDARGALIGVTVIDGPYDCSVRDRNGNGTVDALDAGCGPSDGPSAWVRPIELARPLIDAACDCLGSVAEQPMATPVPSELAEAEGQRTIYTSPTYGYSLSWDSTWTVTSERSDGGSDNLFLDNGTSRLGIASGPTEEFSGQLENCLPFVMEQIANASGAATDATDVEGNPLAGHYGPDDAGVFKVWNLTSRDPEGNALSLFAACLPIPDRDGFVVILQFVATNAYNDQIAAREDVLATLRWSGEPDPLAPASPIATPIAQAPPGVSPLQGGDRRYTSPTFGYELSWNSSWTVRLNDTGDGRDLIALINGSSFVIVTGGPFSGSDVAACLTKSAEAWIANPNQTDGALAPEMGMSPADDPNRPFVVYRYLYTDPEDDGETIEYTVYVECRLFDTNEGRIAIRVLHDTPLAVYDEERAKREQLLANLVIPDSFVPVVGTQTRLAGAK
jgi:hypothetical protein